MKKKILVTGGLGFIGSNLVDKLLEDDNNEVYVIDNLITGSKDYKNEKARYFIMDIRDIFKKKNRSFFKALYGLDKIFHLAALARIQESLKNPAETISVNSSGTLQIAELGRKFNCNIIYASTSAIEGDYFLNPYAYSKWLGEEHFRLYNKLYGLNVGIVRFFNVYGKRHAIEGPYVTVVSVFEQLYLKNKPLTITGDGEQTRDFINVIDICEGLIEISKKEWNCEIFHLGTGKSISINELAEYFQHETTYISARKGEMRHTLADLSFTQSKISWNPKIEIKEYVRNWINKHRNSKKT